MRKIASAYTIERLGLSERKACLLTGVSPSVYGYKSKQVEDDVLRRRMSELAGERKRFGSLRLHIMLKREGAKALQEPRRLFHLLCVLTRGGPWTSSPIAQ